MKLVTILMKTMLNTLERLNKGVANEALMRLLHKIRKNYL